MYLKGLLLLLKTMIIKTHKYIGYLISIICLYFGTSFSDHKQELNDSIQIIKLNGNDFVNEIDSLFTMRQKLAREKLELSQYWSLEYQRSIDFIVLFKALKPTDSGSADWMNKILKLYNKYNTTTYFDESFVFFKQFEPKWIGGSIEASREFICNKPNFQDRLAKIFDASKYETFTYEDLILSIVFWKEINHDTQMFLELYSKNLKATPKEFKKILEQEIVSRNLTKRISDCKNYSRRSIYIHLERFSSLGKEEIFTLVYNLFIKQISSKIKLFLKTEINEEKALVNKVNDKPTKAIQPETVKTNPSKHKGNKRYDYFIIIGLGILIAFYYFYRKK